MALDVFEPIATQVKIDQKAVKDSPTEKLYDRFIEILCSAKGIVESNQRLTSDAQLFSHWMEIGKLTLEGLSSQKWSG